MRRVATLVALTLAWAGAAEAATIKGTSGADRLVGTGGADVLQARAGNDRLEGLGGRDLLDAGSGHDRVIAHADRASDEIACGRGQDIVTASIGDRARLDCEVLSLELMRDPFTTPFTQHETAVEPDTFAWGRTIVSVFQLGRHVDGGADGVGFATSRDAGRTWRRGLLPGLGHASDPVVAYDAAHGAWLAATLGIGTNGTTELRVNASRDGVAWRPPVRIQGREDYDKEWIVCDNSRSSSFRGRCYLAYLSLAADRLAVRRSSDGGRGWSAPVHLPATADEFVNGAFPVVRRNGDLLVLYTEYGSASGYSRRIAAVRSTDGGLTFSAPVTVAPLDPVEVWGIRAPQFVSAEVDASGTIYAAWHDCLSGDCAANDIALARSRDGVTWSQPRRVPAGPREIDHFVPGLAVNPATGGGAAQIAIAYHSLEQGCSLFICRGVEVWLIRSADGGATWTKPRLLTAEPMPIGWLADTGLGRMLGDYISTSYVGGRPIPVFALASAPAVSSFRQGIFAATRVR
jgi:hypothetical protein